MEHIIQAVVSKLGFDPKTHDPSHCWSWPGPFNGPKARIMNLRARLPILKSKGDIYYVRPLLVEYVYGEPLEKHHRVNPCRQSPNCINPFHSRVRNKKNYAEFPAYDQRPIYLLPHEFEERLKDYEGDTDMMKYAFSLNFLADPDVEDPRQSQRG